MYNFLVAAALQEELLPFYELTGSTIKKISKDGDAYEIKIKIGGRDVKILTYTVNKMGMAHNAAALMNIINIHNPKYTLVIGTCAGLIDEERNAGDVMVPYRIFSYESGKWVDGKFKTDSASVETGSSLRKHAELVSKSKERNFNIFTDEDLACGSAVIDDVDKREEIISASARKVRGLDMESYSVGCINSLVSPEKELLVIKGISDFGMAKSRSEKSGNKSLAKENAAKFALELINYLQESIFYPPEDENKLPEFSQEIVNQPNSEKNIVEFPSDKSPIGKIVALKGNNGFYVTTDYDKGIMWCNKATISPWERFLVVDAENDLIALKNMELFVCSENGLSPIKCNRSNLKEWEKFTWKVTTNGKIAFKGNNSCFISSGNGEHPMTCNIAEMNSWEKFEILVQKDFKYREFVNRSLSFNDVQVSNLKRNEAGKEVGEIAIGNVEINDGTLKINRLNNDGRVIIKILKYADKKPFVKKDESIDSLRLIYVKFKAQVTAGTHTLFVICKHVDNDKWIDSASLKIQIDNLEWKNFNLPIRLPSNMNFIIDIVDRDVDNSPSILSIDNFLIYEDIEID